MHKKIYKTKIQSIFKKRSQKAEDSLWVACDCQEPIFKEDLVKNLYVCPKCGKHHKLSSRERFNIFFDEGNYEIINSPKFDAGKQSTLIQIIGFTRRINKQANSAKINNGDL